MDDERLKKFKRKKQCQANEKLFNPYQYAVLSLRASGSRASLNLSEDASLKAVLISGG